MKKILQNSYTQLTKLVRWLAPRLPHLSRHTEGVILLRMDHIGDYVLFRNFIPFIKNTPKYQKRPLILIGNSAFRELAEHFDASFIEHFIWINIPRYYQSRWYKLSILFKIWRLNASELINPVHSRSYLINDLTLFARTKNKISSIGDAVNLQLAVKQESDALFDTLLPSLSNFEFEFFRNKAFIEHLIGERIELSKPHFKEIKKHLKPYQILIFPSAQSPKRCWHPAHFATLINSISMRFPNYKFLILGSQNDITLGGNILKKCLNPLTVKNLCGQTSLVELVEIIAESRLLISNETSAVHIAAAVNTQTVCISNGERFNRFSPYPLSITNLITYFFPNNDFYEKNKNAYLTEQYQYFSNLDINEIKPESVFTTVIKLLEN
jgi:ADP-heptose:LPS heptosyltransferase